MTKAKAKEQPALFEQEQKPPVQINEGSVKKNTNPPPTTERPAAPKSQVAPKKPGTAVAKAEPRSTNLMVVFANAAADPACNPEKMQALAAMVDKMKAEEAEVAFTEAYIDMQEELPSISAKGLIEIEGRTGGRGQKTPYAKYDEIMRVVKPILKKHKFAFVVVSEPNPSGVGVVVRGTLSRVHETQYGKAAHVKQTIIAVPLENSGSKNNVQGIGSSLSYAKRYAAIQLLNIISHLPQDDDNDGAGPKPKKGARAAAADADDGMEDGDDGVQKINGSQEKQLLAEIVACGVKSETFLRHWGITAVKELPYIDYDAAVQACKNYLAKHPKKTQ